MQLNSKLTKPIQEVKYLAAENSWRYRPIMRLFYQEYERLRYWLYKEDVFAELRPHPEFAGYTLEQCQLDLEVLVEWGNLVPVQDTSKASTVAEFKNKQFRYQLSEYSVEIERMTITLENLLVEGASLEPSLIERIKEALQRLPEMAGADSRTVGPWWRELNTDFKSLNQNYQDYIRSFHSLRAEELMKTTAFIAYKDSIIEYLREFVKGLQTNSYWIEATLKNFGEAQVRVVLEKAFNYEKSIPRLETVNEEEMFETIQGRWRSIRRWFLGAGEGAADRAAERTGRRANERDSEVVKLFEITNELIRKITRYAAQIVESRNSAANRKEEYKKLCELFLAAKSLEECHKLSALAFGVFNSRHLKGDLERVTESINSSVYAEPPLVVEIRPHVRTYREKAAKNPIADKSGFKQRLYHQHIQDLQLEREVIQGYIRDDQIDFAVLPQIPPYVRTTLLRWVGKACAARDRTGKTEDGRAFRLMDPPGGARCTLRCDDGRLEMPAYKLRFEGA
ncbi:MAG: TIGR02677 family protein [Firmicutes bacterium]|nr:TIGR02677 family protein [Bacillota bacterium]